MNRAPFVKKSLHASITMYVSVGKRIWGNSFTNLRGNTNYTIIYSMRNSTEHLQSLLALTHLSPVDCRCRCVPTGRVLSLDGGIWTAGPRERVDAQWKGPLRRESGARFKQPSRTSTKYRIFGQMPSSHRVLFYIGQILSPLHYVLAKYPTENTFSSFQRKVSND